jgi:signal transduction histidine kinase
MRSVHRSYIQPLIKVLRPLAVLLFCGMGTVMTWGQASVLTRISDVRSLSAADAQRGLEARIRGIVVYVESYAIMVQDETGGTFFRPSEKQMFLQVGDEIEIHGRTQMGRYIAGLGSVDVQVLRRGLEPPTIAAGHDDVVSARYFYQRVAVEGIVRSINVKQDWTSLRLAMGSRILEVRFVHPPPANLSLIDAKVRLKGLSAGSINDKRQVVETFIRMQSWSDIEVLDPPVPDNEVPRLSASELLAFRPSGRPERRIAVSGTVTAVFPGGEIYLEDEGVAFSADLKESPKLLVGDRVELAGYAEVFQFAAAVVDAEIRQRESGSPPLPVTLTSPDLLTSAHDTRLVAVEARVTDAFKSIDGYILVLAGQKRSLQVHVAGKKAPPEPGALVRVTGICHVEVAPSPEFVRRAGAIHLQARSTEDVSVLESPRWWTTRRLIVVLALLAGAMMVAGIWNVLLHQQVRRKTAALRASIESEAALEERQRIAQEFHDTLEQDLTGLRLRLDAAATLTFDESGRKIMAASQNLLTRIQAETKNIMSNLRDPAFLETDLAGTLEALVKNYEGLEGIEVRAELAPDLLRPAGNTLHHLHMIARESVNNALKHARATLIVIRATMQSDSLVLTVSDNGQGFDPGRDTRGKSGHFGCIGIRERARKIGAAVAWQSSPARGTTVEVVVPNDNSAVAVGPILA